MIKRSVLSVDNAAETVWRPRSTRTRWGSFSAPPDPIAVLGGWGPQEGRRKGDRKGLEGRDRKGWKGEGRDGKEGRERKGGRETAWPEL